MARQSTVYPNLTVTDDPYVIGALLLAGAHAVHGNVVVLDFDVDLWVEGMDEFGDIHRIEREDIEAHYKVSSIARLHDNRKPS